MNYQLTKKGERTQNQNDSRNAPTSPITPQSGPETTPQKIVSEDVRQFDETTRKLKDLRERIEELKGRDKK